jgi:hypothetical protein
VLFFKQRFILKKYLRDVFDPQHDEQILFMIDVPETEADDNKDWQDRREMAERWRQGFIDLGFSVSPLLKYTATGSHNVDLPAFGTQVGVEVPMDDVIVEHTIILSFSEFSATAPLTTLFKTHEHLRGASLPRVQSYMERTSLLADPKYMAYKTEVLADLLNRTNGVRVNFSTSQEMYFDLRHRKALIDNGRCHPDKKGLKLINLPSGEVCINPYEGEIEGKPSETIGIIPAYINGQMIQFFVQNNKIASVVGGGETTEALTAFFEEDDARRNISEFGLGCNERARVTGNQIEDEKAGFHCAYGRSDFLGGTNGRSNFKYLENVIHRDLIFSKGSPIIARKIILTLDDQSTKTIVDNGQYVLFSTRKKFS